MRDGSDLRGRHPGWEEKHKEGKTHPPTGVPAHMLHAEPGSFQDVRLCRDESNLQDSTPCSHESKVKPREATTYHSFHSYLLSEPGLKARPPDL